MTTLELLQPTNVQWCSVPIDWLQQKSSPQLQPNTWVQLLQLLNPYCHDQALLLCQKSDWEWVARNSGSW